MHNLQWYDCLRMCTIVLAVLSMYVMGRRARLLWKSYTNRLRDFWWVVNAFLLLVIDASIENINGNVGLGPKTILGFFATLICLRAALREEGYLDWESESD